MEEKIRRKDLSRLLLVIREENLDGGCPYYQSCGYYPDEKFCESGNYIRCSTYKDGERVGLIEGIQNGLY